MERQVITLKINKAMTDKLTPGHQEDAKKIVEFIGSVKPEAMTDKKQISTMPLLKILTKYAIKHAVAFSGVESNAIVEAMQEHAEAWHSAKMAEVTDEDICNHFPIGAYASSEWQKKQILRRQGAKAMRNGEIKHKEG